MSYILDALRRADSERDRERGKVPGLNAQPVPPGSLELQDGRPNKAWVWVVVGLTLGLAVPLAWRWIGPGDEAVTAEPSPGVRAPLSGPVTQPPAPAPPPAGAMQTPAARPATTPSGPLTPPVASATPEANTALAAPPRPPPKAAPPTTRAEAGRNTARAPAPSPAAPSPATAPTTAPNSPTAPARRDATAPRSPGAPAPAPAEAPVPRLAELPDDVRREVPTLAFGGSVYSELPAQRMVILNGQLLREGDSITNDLAVEQIRQKSAILRIKDRRFELVY